MCYCAVDLCDVVTDEVNKTPVQGVMCYCAVDLCDVVTDEVNKTPVQV